MDFSQMSDEELLKPDRPNTVRPSNLEQISDEELLKPDAPDFSQMSDEELLKPDRPNTVRPSNLEQISDEELLKPDAPDFSQMSDEELLKPDAQTRGDFAAPGEQPPEKKKEQLGFWERKRLELEAKTGDKTSWRELALNKTVSFGVDELSEKHDEWAEKRLMNGEEDNPLKMVELAQRIGLSQDEIDGVTARADSGKRTIAGHHLAPDAAVLKQGFAELAKRKLTERIKTREQAQSRLQNAEEQSGWGMFFSGLADMPSMMLKFLNPGTIAASTGVSAANRAMDLASDTYTLDENGNPVVAKEYKTDKAGNVVVDAEGNPVVKREMRGRSQGAALAMGTAGALAETAIWTRLGVIAKPFRNMMLKMPGVEKLAVKTVKGVAGAADKLVTKLGQSASGRLAMKTIAVLGDVEDKVHLGSLPNMILKSRLTEFCDEVIGLNAREGEREGLVKWIGKVTDAGNNADMLLGLLGMHAASVGFSMAKAYGANKKFRHGAKGDMNAPDREGIVAGYIGREEAKKLSNEDLDRMYRILTSGRVTQASVNGLLDKIARDRAEAKARMAAGETLEEVMKAWRDSRDASQGLQAGVEKLSEAAAKRAKLNGEQNLALDETIKEFLGDDPEMQQRVKDRILQKIADARELDDPEMREAHIIVAADEVIKGSVAGEAERSSAIKSGNAEAGNGNAGEVERSSTIKSKSLDLLGKIDEGAMPVEDVAIGDVEALEPSDTGKAIEEYDPAKAKPIVVWEDLEGNRHAVTGGKRLAMAGASGAETVKGVVVKEADGWTEAEARSLGTTENLREGSGTLKNVVEAVDSIGADGVAELSGWHQANGSREFASTIRKGLAVAQKGGAELKTALAEGRIDESFAYNAAQVLSMERVGEGWEAAQRELAGLVGKVGPEELEAVLWGLKRQLAEGTSAIKSGDFAAAIAEERAKYNAKKGGGEGKLDSDQVLIETADDKLKTLGEIEAEQGNGELGTGNGELGTGNGEFGNEKPGIGNEKPKKVSVAKEGIEYREAKVRLDEQKGKDFSNSRTGISARLSSTGARKLISDAAVAKSVANGFTRRQHNEIAANVGVLFEDASLVESRPDKAGDINIKSIKRFITPIEVDGKEAVAWITVKESTEHGHRIYSVEGIKIAALSPSMRRALADRNSADNAASAHSVPNNLPRVNAAEAPELAAAEGAGANKAVELRPIQGRDGAFGTLSHPNARFTVDGEGKIVYVEGLTPEDFAPGRAEATAALVARIEAYAVDNGLRIGFRDEATLEAWARMRENIKAEGKEAYSRKQMEERRNTVVDRLKQSGLATEVVQTKGDFDRLVTELNGRPLTAGEEVYGFCDTSTGKVYLNPDFFATRQGLDAPIHEFGHLGVIAAQKVNKAVYDRGMKLAGDFLANPETAGSGALRELVDFILNDEYYSKRSRQEQAEELLAQLIGKRGEAALRAETNKTVVNKIESWLVAFWNTFGKALGLKDITPEEAAKMTIEQVADAIRAEMMSGRKYGEGLKGVEFTNGGARVVTKPVRIKRKLSGRRKAVNEFVRLMGGGDDPANPETDLLSLWVDNGGRLFDRMPFDIETTYSKGASGVKKTRRAIADEFTESTAFYRNLDAAQRRVFFGTGKLETGPIGEILKQNLEAAGITRFTREDGTVDFEGLIDEFKRQWTNYENAGEVLKERNAAEEEYYRTAVEEMQRAEQAAYDEISAEEAAGRAEMEAAGEAQDAQIAADIAAGRFSRSGVRFSRRKMTALAKAKVGDSVEGVTADSLRNAIEKRIEDGLKEKEYRFKKPGDRKRLVADAVKFYKRFSQKTVMLSDGRCVYFIPDARAKSERGLSNDEAWAEYAIHAVTSSGGKLEGKNYNERLFNKTKATNIWRLENILKAERCEAQEATEGRDAGIAFYGRGVDGKTIKIITRLDEADNIYADLSEVTVVNDRKKKELPPRKPPAEVVGAVRKGGDLLTDDTKSIPQTGAGAQGDVKWSRSGIFTGSDGKLRFSMAGKKGAANLGLKNAADAEQMEKDGASREEIWRKTGWWRGRDGKWRVEIPDVKRKRWDGDPEERHFMGGGEDFYRYRLTELIEDGDFLKAYPKARDIVVEFHKNMPANVGGNFDEATLTIKMPQKFHLTTDWAKKGLGDGKSAELNEAGRKTIVHELQHAIQLFEGFAKGGSPTEPVRPYALDDKTGHALAVFSEAVGMDPTNDRHLAIIAHYAQKIASDQRGDDVPKRLAEKFETAAKEAGKTPQEFSDEIVRFCDSKTESPMGQYFKLEGEVEARNAKERLNMTPEERAATPPWETEDVPESRQIVRFSRAKAVSDANGNESYKVESNGKTKRYKTPKEALEDFIKELDGQALNEEQQGIYDVVTGVKNTADIRKNDLGELVKFHKGGRGKGAGKIIAVHYAGKRGKVTAKEVIDIGQVIRSGTLDYDGTAEHPYSHTYTATASDGAELKVVIDLDKKGNEAVINFYSDRKTGNGGQRPHPVSTTTSSSPQSIPNSGAGAQGGVRWSRSGKPPEAELVQTTRVADDAGVGEQTPGAIAASRELSRQGAVPIMTKGTRYVSLPLSEMRVLNRYLTGHAMPDEMQSGRKIGAAGKASAKQRKLVIAADVLGTIDKSDMAVEKEFLKQHGFFRNEDAQWAANHTKSEIRQERERSDAALSSRLEALSDRRVHGKEPGGQMAATRVYADQLAKIVMAMPHGQPGVLGAMQTVAGALEKRVRGSEAEAEAFIKWMNGGVGSGGVNSPTERKLEMFAAFLMMPKEMESRAKGWYDGIRSTIAADKKLTAAFREMTVRMMSEQGYVHLQYEIERAMEAQTEAAIKKLNAESNEPIAAGGLRARATEAVVLSCDDRMGAAMVRVDAATRNYLAAQKLLMKQAKTPADRAAIKQQTDIFIGEIAQAKNQVELSRTAWERGHNNVDARYLWRVVDILNEATVRDGLKMSDISLYLDQQRVIETKGLSGSRGESARQAQIILDAMKKRLGGDYAKIEAFAQKFHAIHEQELLNDPALERVLGKGTVEYWKSQTHYVTTKRQHSPEELAEIEAARRLVGASGKAGGDTVVGQMYKYCTRPDATAKLKGSFADKQEVMSATLEKVAAIKKWVRRNDYVIELRDLLVKANVEGVHDFAAGKNEFPNNRRYGSISYMENGQKRTLVVPREIADGFKAQSMYDNAALKLCAGVNNIARQLWIDWNPVYWQRNIARNAGSIEMNMPGMREAKIKRAVRFAFPGLAPVTEIAMTHLVRHMPERWSMPLRKVWGEHTALFYAPKAKRMAMWLTDHNEMQRRLWDAERRGDLGAIQEMEEDRRDMLAALRANMLVGISAGKASGTTGFLDDSVKTVGKTMQREIQDAAKKATWRKALDTANIFSKNAKQQVFEDVMAKFTTYLHDRAQFGNGNNRTAEESGLVVKKNVSIGEGERKGGAAGTVQAVFQPFWNMVEKGVVRNVKAYGERTGETLEKAAWRIAPMILHGLIGSGAIAAWILKENDNDEEKVKSGKLGEVYRYLRDAQRAYQNCSNYVRNNYHVTPLWTDGYTSVILGMPLTDEERLLKPIARFVTDAASVASGTKESMDLAGFMSDATGTIAPDFKIAGALPTLLDDTVHALMENPTDYYTGGQKYDKDLHALRNESWGMRGRFLAAMGKRLWNDFGGRNVLPVDRAGVDNGLGKAPGWVATMVNDIPIVSPILRSFVKVQVGSPRRDATEISEAEARSRAIGRICAKDMFEKARRENRDLSLDPVRYGEMLDKWQQAYGLTPDDMAQIEARYLNAWRAYEGAQYNAEGEREKYRDKAEKLGLDAAGIWLDWD